MKSILRIAARNVLRNHRRSLITLSAVLLAVGIMVSVRGLLNGLQASLREGVVHGQTGAIQVHRKGYLKSIQGAPLDLDLPADDAFLGRIAAVPGVTAVAPRISFGGMANAHDTTVFALFWAIDPAREFRVCPQRRDAIAGGGPLHEGEGDGPASTDLSDELQRRIGVRPGDTVTLLTNDHEGVLNAADVRVAGTLSMALPLPDRKIAWLPLGAAQSLLRMEGRATEIAVATADLEHLDPIVARIRDAVGPAYEVTTWHEVAAFIDDVVATQDAVLGVVMYTFLVIALIGIANAMLMNVLERVREIGTMMAVGMRRRQILALFLVEAALLGIAGGIAGALVGGVLVAHYGAVGMHFRVPGGAAPLTIHPFITAAYVGRTFVLATLGAALAALYPAWMASRLRPIEALSRS